jgi:hypothetical protein
MMWGISGKEYIVRILYLFENGFSDYSPRGDSGQSIHNVTKFMPLDIEIGDFECASGFDIKITVVARCAESQSQYSSPKSVLSHLVYMN